MRGRTTVLAALNFGDAPAVIVLRAAEFRRLHRLNFEIATAVEGERQH
jgi:hypothetical protein